MLPESGSDIKSLRLSDQYDLVYLGNISGNANEVTWTVQLVNKRKRITKFLEIRELYLHFDEKRIVDKGFCILSIKGCKCRIGKMTIRRACYAIENGIWLGGCLSDTAKSWIRMSKKVRAIKWH